MNQIMVAILGLWAICSNERSWVISRWLDKNPWALDTARRPRPADAYELWDCVSDTREPRRMTCIESPIRGIPIAAPIMTFGGLGN